jgi:hypothetical protein
MKNLLVIVVSASAMTVACAAGVEPATPLLDQCAGTYSCKDPGGSTTLVLQKSGDVCAANGIALHPDGTCDLHDCTWSGDSLSFQTCFGTECSTCAPMAAPSKTDAGSNSGGAKCTGTPNDCGEEDPPYCSNTRGCYMATRLNYDNSFDNYCAGSGDSCDDMDTEGDCQNQGCVWKP